MGGPQNRSGYFGVKSTLAVPELEPRTVDLKYLSIDINISYRHNGGSKTQFAGVAQTIYYRP